MNDPIATSTTLDVATSVNLAGAETVPGPVASDRASVERLGATGEALQAEALPPAVPPRAPAATAPAAPADATAGAAPPELSSEELQLRAEAEEAARKARWAKWRADAEKDKRHPPPPIGGAIPLEASKITQRSHLQCGDDELNFWHHENLKTMELLDLLNNTDPVSGVGLTVYADFGGGDACHLTDLGPQRLANSPPKVVSLVHRSEAPFCSLCGPGIHIEDWYDRIRHSSRDFSYKIVPEVLPATPRMLRHAPEVPTRNIGVIWPQKGCSKLNPCPLVVFLTGHYEKGTSADFFYQDSAVWAYPNMFQCDGKCREELGSVMIFPEQLPDEMWDRDAEDWLGNFVIPYIHTLGERFPGVLDFNHISIVGLSEGGRAAINAVFLFPDVFTTVMAVGLARADEMRLPNMTDLPVRGPSRLRDIVVVAGAEETVKVLYEVETDPETPIQGNTAWVVKTLSLAPAFQKASFHLRFYKTLDHISILDVPLNGWASAYAYLWKGDFSGYIVP